MELILKIKRPEKFKRSIEFKPKTWSFTEDEKKALDLFADISLKNILRNIGDAQTQNK